MKGFCGLFKITLCEKQICFFCGFFLKKTLCERKKDCFFCEKVTRKEKKINDVCFGLFKIKLSRRVQFWFELRIFDLLFKGMLPFKMRKLFWNSRHVKFYDEEVFISTWTLVIDFLSLVPLMESLGGFVNLWI